MIADNLLRGGELAGGLMDMGRQLNSVEMTRAALREGDLRHLGVLLQQGAIGEWLSREEIATCDRECDRARREQREAERARELRALGMASKTRWEHGRRWRGLGGIGGEPC